MRLKNVLWKSVSGQAVGGRRSGNRQTAGISQQGPELPIPRDPGSCLLPVNLFPRPFGGGVGARNHKLKRLIEHERSFWLRRLKASLMRTPSPRPKSSSTPEVSCFAQVKFEPNSKPWVNLLVSFHLQ